MPVSLFVGAYKPYKSVPIAILAQVKLAADLGGTPAEVSADISALLGGTPADVSAEVSAEVSVVYHSAEVSALQCSDSRGTAPGNATSRGTDRGSDSRGTAPGNATSRGTD